MEYQKMTSIQDEVTEYTSYQKANKATESNVRLILQNRKMITLPKEVLQLTNIPYLELDLSYNRTIDIDKVIEQLSSLDNLKGVAFTKNDIGNIPESIAQLKNLESLILWNNGLSSLPESVKKLARLKYLHLRTNKLAEIPTPVFELKELKYLCLRNNKFKKIPHQLFTLSNLEHLDISNCGIADIPDEIEQLTELRVLEIEGNKLQSLPKSISKLKKLEKIIFRNNKELVLADVLEIIKNLPLYKTLDLSAYALTSIPASIGTMQQLETINLEGNNLTDLPESFNLLTNLTSLNIKGNPQLPLPVFLKAIAGISSITKLSTWEIPVSNSIPDEIGLCFNIEEISLSGNYKSISPEIGKLKKLRNLYISANDENAAFSLPDIFDKLTALEYFSISNVKQLQNIPDTIYKSSSIKNLNWHTNLKLDFSRLKTMKSLEDLGININEEKELIEVAELCGIKRLTLIYAGLKKLPGYFSKMIALKDFNFGGLPELDVEDAITKLPYLETLFLGYQHHTKLPSNIYTLKNLKTLYLGYQVPISFAAIIELVEKCSSLQEIEFNTGDAFIPGNIHLLNRLTSCKINYYPNYSSEKTVVDTSLQFGLLNMDTVKFVRYTAGLKQQIETVKKIKTLNLQTDEQKMTAFGLLTGAFEKLKHQLHNPFKGDESLRDKNIYIFGKPTLSTLKELQTNLKNRGSAIAKNLDDSVSHILLTSQFKDDIASILFSNKPIILEDFIKQQVFKEDAPYLMSDGNDELTEQITRLLRSEEEENMQLVLELIEGGGANKRLVAYLMVIHLKHNNADIRKKARSLFRKFASADLQTHLKNTWKESFKEKNYTDFISVFQHTDVDIFDCIFALHITNLHTNKAKGNNNDYQFKSLTLRGLKEGNFPTSFKYLDFIENIYIEGNDEFDMAASYPNFSHFNLKNFSISNCTFEKFPSELLDFPNLESLTLSGKWGESRYCLTIPSLTPHANLKALSFYQFDIAKVENLKPVAQSLKNFTIDNSNISEVPLFINGCTQLTHLSLCNNPIEKIDIDFSLFINLESLSLHGCPVEKLPDTFYNCSKLHDISFSKMRLKEIPFSLLTIGKGDTGSIYLRLNENEITCVAAVPEPLKERNWQSMLSKNIHYFNLDDNKFKDFPAILSKIKIDELRLSKNPLETFPSDIGEYKHGRVSLDQTNITKIPVALFYSAANFSISNYNHNIELPPLDTIPSYKGNKSFYTNKETDDFKKLKDAINKKMIPAVNEY
jgi:Leucine-rich repeat (LRR) protein